MRLIGFVFPRDLCPGGGGGGGGDRREYGPPDRKLGRTVYPMTPVVRLHNRTIAGHPYAYGTYTHVPLSEAWLSPWKKCPPGHSCLGTTVPPDTGA